MRRVVKLNTSLTINASEIDSEAFLPFGDVIRPAQIGARSDWSGAFENSRPNARINLYTTAVEAVGFPVKLAMLERHFHSFQTFIPLDIGRYLICVAPNGAGDLPAIDSIRAFIVSAGLGITYRANIWHHPMMALDHTGQFAVWMWLSGGHDDEEFVDLTQPVWVQAS
jgi:ureidoglycolate lyase